MRKQAARISARLFLVSATLLAMALVWSAISHRNVARAAVQGGQAQNGGGIWEEVAERRQGLALTARGVPSGSRTVRLNRATLISTVSRASREVAGTAVQGDTIISLPFPEDGYRRFLIEESPVLEPALAAQYPDIKSYRGQGVDDPSMGVRFDVTPEGFHATVSTKSDTFAIQPSGAGDSSNYIVYHADEASLGADDFSCEVTRPVRRPSRSGGARTTSGVNAVEAVASGPVRRTYRIAIATTQEYTNSIGGGSVSSTISTLNTWLNGINLIYERELSIRLVLVGSNSSIIYTSEPDPFTNGTTGSMMEQARNTINSQIGASNYDIGHVFGAFSTSGASGQAYLGVVCWDPYKGAGATVIGSGLPVGHTGIVSVISHEIGHQFGADHTFNTSCANNRNPATGWESGSGLSLLSYAGNCAPDNITNSRSMHFFSGSIQEIESHIAANSCASTSSTGNAAPTVDAGPNYTIPRNTPFTLVATGNDADIADQPNLSFSWEEIDAGNSYVHPPYSDAGDPANSTRPIFRPFAPTTSPSRTFPSLTYILNNANVPPATSGGLQVAESLPNVSRQLNFNCIVRDGRGGTTIDSMFLSVTSAAGPFQVTQPNSGVSWTTGSTQTVTWNVNGTNLSPVNCANVRISLSTDGGLTFPTILASSTPNDGSESVVFNQSSTACRVKVEAINNVFFDISDTNFTVAPAGSCHAVSSVSPSIGSTGTTVDIAGLNLNGVSGVTFTGGAIASFNVISSTLLRVTVPSGAQSGPITVTKPGCSNATTSSFTFSTTDPVMLQIDDGTYESAYSAGGWAVNRLTPSAYPATLTSVWIYFASFSNSQVGDAIDIVVGTNTDGDNNINGTSFQVLQRNIQALNQFNVYSVPSLVINSGDFVVGFRHAVVNGVFPIVYDRTAPNNSRSYASSDGVNWVLQDSFGSTFAGDAAIRATVFQGNPGPTCTPSISPPVRYFSSAASSGSVAVTVQTGCNWSTSNSNSWIQVTNGSGSGNGTATFNVLQNTGTTIRTGTLTVAGQTLTVRQGINFSDVPFGSTFFEHIGKMAAAQITIGCAQDTSGNWLFCPTQSVNRDQMAAFLIRGLGDFNPPTPAQQRYVDVPPSHLFYAYIEQMALRGIDTGCSTSPPQYCSSGNITREQMAGMMIRALGVFNPPTPAQQRFIDVPPSNPYYAYIEEMAVRGITLGCDANGPLYCPSALVSREQISAFLVRAFGL